MSLRDPTAHRCIPICTLAAYWFIQTFFFSIQSFRSFVFFLYFNPIQGMLLCFKLRYFENWPDSLCVRLALRGWETLLDRISRHGCSRALWDQTDRQYLQVIIISSIYLPFISKCLYCIQGELILLIRAALPICDHRLPTSRWCLLYFFQWENNENLIDIIIDGA